MIRKSALKIVILTLLLSVFISACSPGSATTLDGPALLEQRCTECHTLDRVERASKSPAQWGTTVRRMVNKGAELNTLEQEVLIEYLSSAYP